MIEAPAYSASGPRQSQPSGPGAADRPHYKRGLALLAALLIVVVIALVALVIWSSRQYMVTEVRRSNNNLDMLLAEQTMRSLQAVDLVLQATADQIRSAGIRSPEAFRSELDNEPEHDILRDRLRNLPQVMALSLIGADGKAVVSTWSWPAKQIDMSNRDFIRNLRDHPEAAISVGAAAWIDAGDEWTIVLARRVSGSNGALLGFVVAPLTLRYFQQFYRGVTLRDASAVDIMRRDGLRLLHYPYSGAVVGSVVAATSVWHHIVADGGGDFASQDPAFGAPSFVAVRPLPDYPLVVDVSVSQDTALATWRRDARFIAIGGLAIVLAIIAGFGLLARQFRRLATSEWLLAQKNADLERTQHRLETQATELRRIADALVGSERLIVEKSAVLETTLEFMGQGIMMISADRTVAVCNQRTIEMLDLPPEMKTPGTPFADIVAFQWRTDEFRHTPADIQDFIRAGGLLDQPHVYERRRPDGQMLEVRSTPMPDGGVVRTYTDVTERRLAEDRAALAREQAEQARALAEEASHAKTDFLVRMSHEIRTPMNGIIGMNAVLLASHLTEEQRECAVAVSDSAQSLLTVINDILDISKLEARRVELEAIDLDLVDLVEGAVGLFGPAAREKRIDLATFVDPAAWCGFRGDPTRLRQLLLNLVGNAIKFTDTGAVTVEVMALPATGASAGSKPGEDDHGAGTHDGSAPGGGVRFEVADTGPGISARVQERLFEPFAQADSSISRRFGGTGLGLAICRQLVELMGGKIGVISTPGRGSRFFFEVPLVPASVPMPLDRSLPKRLRGLRALVVDDGTISRRLMHRQLAAIGLDVTAAKNGFQVMAELERARHRGLPFDLAMIDPALPPQDGPTLAGVALARRIRDMPGTAELRLVIVCSADHDALSPTSPPLVDAVLTRPVREQSLLGTLSRLFGMTATEDPAPAPPDAGQRMLNLSPLRIVVAEDNKINRRLMVILLNAAGHHVAVADNGMAAVEAVAQGGFDLVLMDIQMPVLDGIGAMRRIRAMPEPMCSIPILALTADAIGGAEGRYLAAGADAHLAKPITQAALQAALVALAGRRHVPLGNAAPETSSAVRMALDDVPPAGLASASLDPASASALPPAELDRSVVAELRRIFTPEQFDSFLADALDDIPPRIARLGQRLGEADLQAAMQEAHDLVSLIGNCGGRRASMLVHLVERMCRAGDGEAALARYHEFAPVAATALAELAAQRQFVG